MVHRFTMVHIQYGALEYTVHGLTIDPYTVDHLIRPLSIHGCRSFYALVSDHMAFELERSVCVLRRSTPRSPRNNTHMTYGSNRLHCMCVSIALLAS